MAARETLSVENRTIFGKQLKKLRREGILPGNVYGKNFTSTAVQLPYQAFQEVFAKVGETGVIDLEVNGKKHPVLIHNIAINPINHEPLHVDFFIVNLKEKITARVPVVATGEATAATNNEGMLLQLLNEAEIEALPTELPESIEVDVTPLAAVGDQITVAELKAPQGVTLLNEPEQAVFRIGELVSQEAEEQEALEEAEAEAQSEESEAEAATPTEEEKASEGEQTPTE